MLPSSTPASCTGAKVGDATMTLDTMNAGSLAGRRGQLLMMLACGGLAACSASLPSIVRGPPGDSAPSLEARIDKPEEVAGKTTPSSNPKSKAIGDLAKASAENPKDPTIAMAYVRVLKSAGQRNEALAVLDAASDANPAEMMLAVEQGLLALELGQSIKAEGALHKVASGPERDWRVLSGLGVAASSQGNQKEAQRHFAKALEMSPNNPAVLNNMAVSLILDRKVDQAEAALRRAAKAGAPRLQVAQNLALIKALKSEMETGQDNGGEQAPQ